MRPIQPDLFGEPPEAPAPPRRLRLDMELGPALEALESARDGDELRNVLSIAILRLSDHDARRVAGLVAEMLTLGSE